MKVFLRLLGYLAPYRFRFFLGVFVSFLVALLSGLNLTIFLPLFGALSEKSSLYLSQFTEKERGLLRKAFEKTSIPKAPKKLDYNLSQTLTLKFNNNNFSKIDFLEKWELKTTIYGKLKLSSLGLSPVKVVFYTALFVFVICALKLFLFLITIRLIGLAGYLAVRNLRNDLYLKVQYLPLTWFYKTKSGELVSRLSSDPEIIAAVFANNLRNAIESIFLILVHVLVLAYFNLYLFFIAIVTLPVILLPITFFTRKIRSATHRSQNLLSEMNSYLQEMITGIRLVRFMRTERYEEKRFQRVNQRLYWRRFKEIFYNNLGSYLVEFNSVIVIVGILSLGAIFIDPSEFTSAEFLVFTVALIFTIQPIIQLSGIFAKIQGTIVSGSRIFEIIDKEYETKEPKEPTPVEPLKEKITFENVYFAYPETDKKVLKNINLEVKVGSTVALVGESGGGKSTLVDLLLRFFSPTSGNIFFDEHNIQQFQNQAHRARIGIVTQDIFLFYGSIYNNISYGKRRASQKEIEKAARLAYAHDFIIDLPEAYHTLVGNRGLNLSGGQRQRIAIARALLRDPEILILDEATSALDTHSENLVQLALNRLFQNRTTFVIAHRLSTIEKADLIIVISNGEIIEQGTHKELLRKGGHYSYLQKISLKNQKETKKEK